MHFIFPPLHFPRFLSGNLPRTIALSGSEVGPIPLQNTSSATLFPVNITACNHTTIAHTRPSYRRHDNAMKAALVSSLAFSASATALAFQPQASATTRRPTMTGMIQPQASATTRRPTMTGMANANTCNGAANAKVMGRRPVHVSRLYSAADEEDYDDDGGEMRFEVRSDSSFRPETSTFGAEAVPEEQRPSNEYLDLIRQPLFGWASQESGDSGLAIRLAATYVAFYALICYPIAGATYTLDGYLVQKLAAANVGAATVLLVLMIRLYSGWGYVGSRLQSKVIEYEETGWYDGDIELKTEAEKARDMFLYRSDVMPVENRLKLFAAGIGAFWLASIVGFNVASNTKPLFDEYNPEMLKTLTYDDKIAGVAAQQSGGVPTYCNSRYYRAVANGGQGCK